ncbi:protein kinase domain-containing protein [Polyangium aurulentum]|uniref:protein kinase domain-containing protein n=1 Tax=Polyangium aurulentum TaxID=2567896 RepID=UPI0010AEAE0A|nr:AAA family ATPase [Polyangium aurulentum]UQA57237.1 AAA family ATPase [Polyangium aurulentum]
MIEIAGYTFDVPVHEGVATVLYRGSRNEDGSKVAVKILRNAYPTWRELSGLRREHAILRELDVAGVPRALDLVEQERRLALVMEDLGPTSLADLLVTQGRLDPESALRIAIPLGRTLDELHRRRIVHKDMKPRNVMIAAGTLAPYLVDFGLAARISQETAAPDVLEGTLAYIAPEQTGRINRPVDRRSDLYSLGATLYEMLTGAPPFNVTDEAEAIHAHLVRVPQPLHTRAPAVPKALSDVVLKLLEKAPEDRYQSARGVVFDLEECLRQLGATGTVEPFPLGRGDRVEEIRTSDRLVGRENELDALSAALERAKSGTTALALVKGSSGIGKSAMVRELVASRAGLCAAFASGKFDPMARSKPLSAVGQALRSLVRGALAEPKPMLEVRKRDLVAAVGSSGRLIADLCPELAILLGPQREPPALGPSEAKNRLALVMRRVLSAFARDGAPLVLFLDDLQWADPGSLDLLVRILSDPDTRNLLVVGAYRDDEVDAAHPLMATLDALSKAGVPLVDINLGPLSAQATTAIVAHALDAEPQDAEPLAAVAWTKTQGNPFFLSQFLRALHEDGLLVFDRAAGRFTWDLEQVKGAMVTDNVLALMARKVDRLAPSTRRALLLAACIGPTFDLWTLATLLEVTPSTAAASLWEALRDGLVQPLGADYRLLDSGADVPDGAELSVSYQFVHDRVQEACYALVPQEERAALHLAIGRQLIARAGGELPDDALLEVARHLNLGASHITDPAERMQTAMLDLRAGRRAMAAAAHEAAAGLFAAGRALTGEEGFERDHDGCFALWLEGAECEALSGEMDRAEALLDELLRHASTTLERARAEDVRVRMFARRGRFADAARVGLSTLAELGVTFPEGDAERGAAFGEAMGKLGEILADRRIEDLVEAETIDDPEESAIQALLLDSTIPAFYASPALYGLLAVEQVRRSLVHGHTVASPYAYSAYGYMLALILGRHAEGVAFGKLSLALADKQKSAAIAAKLQATFAQSVYVREPLSYAIGYFERGLSATLEVGDYNYLAATLCGISPMRIAAGQPLEPLRAEIDRCLVLARRTHDVLATAATTLSAQVVSCLLGGTRGSMSLEADGFDEAAWRAGLDEKNHGLAIFYLHAYKLFLAVLYGAPEAAIAQHAEAERHSAGTAGTYWTVYIWFLASLAHLASARAAKTPEERSTSADAASAQRDRIAAFVASCPANFANKLALLDAERAALDEARWPEALDLYDKAIRLAHEHVLPHEEAIANELCGRFLLRRGRERAARGYLADAYRGFLYWGASAKARALAQELPEIVGALNIERRGATTRSQTIGSLSGATIFGRATTDSLRDAALVLRAAQTIAGEVVLSRVISRLMRIVVENAGAESGALLLSRGEELTVEATFQASPEIIQVGQRRPLEEHTELPEQVVLYAWRTREALSLDDAPSDARFAADRYLRAKKTRSILCLPVSHQGRPIGLLYLEHSSSTGVFTDVRAELIGLLASQAAIAIENAMLVEGVQAANEEVRRANERLEREVAERTRDLEKSNRELFATNALLARELDERAQAEAERAALREQMLDAQRARLAELAAPLLPISEDVLVMPIIGTVDAERAGQVMETALDGAQRFGARVMILDITGMRHVDTAVVSALLSVTRALELLGTQTILTGVRPSVAQAIVDLDADFTGIATLSTLRAGIARVLSGRARRSR